MSETILSICLLSVCCHPIYYILRTTEYQANNHNSLYFKTDIISKLASSKIAIIASLILFFGFIAWQPNVFLGLPLVFITWTLFIRDRFRSLSRGLGAPGYFNFLGVIGLFTTNILATNQENGGAGNLLITVIYIILFVETGSIFLSAGLFKSLDCQYQPPGFTIGMLNPMWSKIYKYRRFLSKIRIFIDNLGPILQIISGLTILLLSTQFKFFGFYLIIGMFLSITPFCRLGWLCPSIACSSYTLVKDNYIEVIFSNDLYVKIFAIAAFLRLLIMGIIFSEYFQGDNCKIFNISSFRKLLHYPLYIYRTFLGVIIWKVFTYDLVRITSSTCSRQLEAANLFSDCTLSENAAIKLHDEICTQTNVYDSITLTSLICSQKYSDQTLFNSKIQKYMQIYNLEELYYYKDDYSRNFLRNDLLGYCKNKNLIKILYENNLNVPSIYPSQLNYVNN